MYWRENALQKHRWLPFKIKACTFISNEARHLLGAVSLVFSTEYKISQIAFQHDKKTIIVIILQRTNVLLENYFEMFFPESLSPVTDSLTTTNAIRTGW